MNLMDDDGRGRGSSVSTVDFAGSIRVLTVSDSTVYSHDPNDTQHSEHIEGELNKCRFVYTTSP